MTDAELRPLDVRTLARDADALGQARREIRQRLMAQRDAFPQIPTDLRKLDGLAGRLLEVVLGVLDAPSASRESLAAALQALQVKGMGQANQVWSELFTLSSAQAEIDIPKATRAELSDRLRELLRGDFSERPEQLDWAIAKVLAWRPRSPAELHKLLASEAPGFPSPEAFADHVRGRLSFSREAVANEEPDWSLLWQYQGVTGYGGAYPEDVRAFLVAFLSSVKDADPAASILDIGTGNHGATLLARGISDAFDLWGIDVAKLPAPPAESRIRTLCMSADRLSFADGQFSAVMSVNGIEYADIDKAIPEMHRVMRPGAPAALVLHRPDSLVLRSARTFLDFAKAVPLLETLALTWLYLHEGSTRLREQVMRRVGEMSKIEVGEDFGRYYATVMKGIPEVVAMRASARSRAFELLERFEKDLRWRHQRDEFMVSHMARIPDRREELLDWFRRENFVVDSVGEVFHDTARDRQPLGWAVRVRKP